MLPDGVTLTSVGEKNESGFVKAMFVIPVAAQPGPGTAPINALMLLSLPAR